VFDRDNRPTMILAVISGLLVVGLGTSVFLDYAGDQRASQEKQLLKGEITDLRYELAQRTATPAPTPPADEAAPSPTPAPAATPAAVLGDQTTAPATATVVGGVNLRKSASTSGKSLGWLNGGTVVTLGKLSGSWQEVTVNGQHGYIKKSYLKY
jgi:uncharacterized protein YgiM (DUF1202 family)